VPECKRSSARLRYRAACQIIFGGFFGDNDIAALVLRSGMRRRPHAGLQSAKALLVLPVIWQTLGKMMARSPLRP
jgi:hypothetical protein